MPGDKKFEGSISNWCHYQTNKATAFCKMSNERFFLIVCYDIANDNINIKICHVIGYESMSSFFCAMVKSMGGESD